MIEAEHAYTTRFAANRARDRKEDATAWDIEKRDDGKFYLIGKKPGAEKKAVAALKTAGNPTRVAELKRAKEKKAAKPKKAAAEKALGKRAEVTAAAEAGKLPAPPDFSAETHKRFRPKLEELVKLAKAKDVKGLKTFEINPISSSPKALDRYRNLAVLALEAQAKAARA